MSEKARYKFLVNSNDLPMRSLVAVDMPNVPCPLEISNQKPYEMKKKTR